MGIKILVLGHNGMLGRTVFSYLNKVSNYSVHTIENDYRWPAEKYKEEIKKYDWIINCSGSIPQKNPNISDLFSVNTDLPLYLLSTGKNVIHASTDCEYSGEVDKNYKYSIDDIEDAKDEYGISKGIVTKFIKNIKHNNFKIIRSSIIGIEESTNYSLLNWAISNFKNDIDLNGFDNHYWNGITTLEWSKICLKIINGDLENLQIVQPGIKTLSKYELLLKIKEKFYKKSRSKIIKVSHKKSQNKSLEANIEVPSIDIMLEELKNWVHI